MESIEIKRRARIWIVFIALLAAFFILVSLNVMLGSVQSSISDTLSALFGRGGDMADILWKIRLPRMLACVLWRCACTFGLPAADLFNNPIAGPYVLGISSGAKLS